MNIWILLGGLNALLAVAAGAYGWHALGPTPDIRDIFMMGSQYQMWHGLALLAVGLLAAHAHARALTVAGVCFQVGIFLFSGTLYSFGELMIVPVEGAAPFGGGLLMLGWLIVAVEGARRVRLKGPDL